MSINPSAAGYTGLVGPDGKPRSGWDLVEAPPVQPTTPGAEIEMPHYGDVEASPSSPGIPAEIKPSTEETTPKTSVPVDTKVDEVKYTEPPPPPKEEKTIEVAGSGMGADKKYKMLESEALAVYTTLRDHKGNMSVEDMAKALKDKYGIDAEVTTVDGHKAVVNKATGNTIAVDTNGNGSLDMSDMKLKEALLEAGIDPDFKANPAVFDLATKVIQDSIEESQKRREEEEKAYQASQAAKAGTNTNTGTGANADGVAAPTPAPAATPAAAPAATTTTAAK